MDKVLHKDAMADRNTCSCVVGQDKPVTDAALEFSMRPVNYGLYSTLALTCGFAQSPPKKVPDSGADSAWHFVLALWSNLPADLPVTAIEVCSSSHFQQPSLSIWGGLTLLKQRPCKYSCKLYTGDCLPYIIQPAC